MHVLVFKVSKEIQIVPDYRTSIEFFSATAESVPFVDMDRNIMIDKQVWQIRKFSRYECEPSAAGMPLELKQGRRIDTYVAIDPELEKFVAIPYEQQVNEISGKLNSERISRMQRELEIETWWQQPWYKRVWLALKGGPFNEGIMFMTCDMGYDLKAGIPLVTKNSMRLSNAVVHSVIKSENRSVVTVISDFGNIMKFPSVEDVLEHYDISEGYLEYYRWSKELNIDEAALDAQFCLRDRLEKQIELLTKALEGLNGNS